MTQDDYAKPQARQEPPPPIDPVVERVRADLHQRSQLGMMKYGTTLAGNDLDLKGWLQHAYEECLDQANYLMRAIMEIEQGQLASSQMLAEEFCRWPLPEGTASDRCACEANYPHPRSGTNLLTVNEAKQFFDHARSLKLLK